MLSNTDFAKKQILCLFPYQGDKLSYKNDNIVVKDKDGKVKHQSTCYQLFMIIVVGDISITSGLIKRCKKFNFSICLFTYNFKLYSVIGNRMEGNTLLHEKQYNGIPIEISNKIIENKISNEVVVLKNMRSKLPIVKEAIHLLDKHALKIENYRIERNELMGLEGSAARVYFAQVFNNVNWNGRKPRIKSDYINSCLDIGYTVLFNIIDSILQVFGFDVYAGVYHTSFYMRKSLVCDIMEPFRVIIDSQIRKAFNLGQFKDNDFVLVNGQYQLQYKKSPEYVAIFLKAILEYKNDIFLYIRDYYRWYMKGKSIDLFPQFKL